MMSELSGATAMALMFAPTEALMMDHEGPALLVFGVAASLVRHKRMPPASSRFESRGSRMKGAMKLAFARMPPPEHESVMVYGDGLHPPNGEMPLIQSAPPALPVRLRCSDM